MVQDCFTLSGFWVWVERTQGSAALHPGLKLFRRFAAGMGAWFWRAAGNWNCCFGPPSTDLFSIRRNERICGAVVTQDWPIFHSVLFAVQGLPSREQPAARGNLNFRVRVRGESSRILFGGPTSTWFYGDSRRISWLRGHLKPQQRADAVVRPYTPVREAL
jgi:hypothetical protein